MTFESYEDDTFGRWSETLPGDTRLKATLRRAKMRS